MKVPANDGRKQSQHLEPVGETALEAAVASDGWILMNRAVVAGDGREGIQLALVQQGLDGEHVAHGDLLKSQIAAFSTRHATPRRVPRSPQPVRRYACSP